MTLIPSELMSLISAAWQVLAHAMVSPTAAASINFSCITPPPLLAVRGQIAHLIHKFRSHPSYTTYLHHTLFAVDLPTPKSLRIEYTLSPGKFSNNGHPIQSQLLHLPVSLYNGAPHTLASSDTLMAQPRTLFSLLLEQPWWISALVGVGLFGIAQLAFPPVAPFVALPFVLIALYVGYRQLRTVSPGKVGERLQAARELSWDQFSAVVVAAYQREGYTVAPAQKSAHDYTLTQQGRVTLLQCRRWKVNLLGVGPLEELARAVAREDAYKGLCIAAGKVSPQARAFVDGKPLALVTGMDLAVLLGNLKNISK